jgi:hypothetical protein
MENFSQIIKSSKNLDELADNLNSYEAGKDELKIDEVIDLSSLPTFGKIIPRSTIEIFSWDSERVLIQGSEGFEIQAK